MPTSYEAALMSYLVYDFDTAKEKLKDEKIFKHKRQQYPNLNKSDMKFLFGDLFPNASSHTYNHYAANYLSDRNWKIYDSSDVISFLGYKAVALINHKRKEIVIAHRGTTLGIDVGSQSNYQDDIEILKGTDGEVPKALSEVIIYIVRIIRKLEEKYPNYAIHQTGHSLGGFFAEFGAAYMADPKPVFSESLENLEKKYIKYLRLKTPRLRHANAITFDSLGSVNVLTKLNIQSGKANTINYFLEPNIANTANPHDGQKRLLLAATNNYSVMTTAMTSEVAININKQFNLQEVHNFMNSHALKNMTEKFDPKTGEPSVCKRIIQWPIAKNTFIKSDQPMNLMNTSNTIGDLIKSFAADMVHTLTGVVDFKHQRTGLLAYEDMTMASDGITKTALASQNNNQSRRNSTYSPVSSFYTTNQNNNLSVNSNSNNQQSNNYNQTYSSSQFEEVPFKKLRH